MTNNKKAIWTSAIVVFIIQILLVTFNVSYLYELESIEEFSAGEERIIKDYINKTHCDLENYTISFDDKKKKITCEIKNASKDKQKLNFSYNYEFKFNLTKEVRKEHDMITDTEMYKVFISRIDGILYREIYNNSDSINSSIIANISGKVNDIDIKNNENPCSFGISTGHCKKIELPVICALEIMSNGSITGNFDEDTAKTKIIIENKNCTHFKINFELYGNMTYRKNCEYLFSWDDVSENNTELIEFLNNTLIIEWVENAEINKRDNDTIINVTEGNNSLIFKLNKKENKVRLEISDGETYDYISKEENGTINIYSFDDQSFDMKYNGSVNVPSENILNKHTPDDTFKNLSLQFSIDGYEYKDNQTSDIKYNGSAYVSNENIPDKHISSDKFKNLSAQFSIDGREHKDLWFHWTLFFLTILSFAATLLKLDKYKISKKNINLNLVGFIFSIIADFHYVPAIFILITSSSLVVGEIQLLVVGALLANFMSLIIISYELIIKKE